MRRFATKAKIHQGAAAIRDWMDATTRKYRVTVEVADATVNGHAWLVTAGLVSGNFPGSPATLHYNFTVAGDRIKGLGDRRIMQKGAADAAPFLFLAKCLGDQFIVGMTNSAPSLTPDGQREVTVLVLV